MIWALKYLDETGAVALKRDYLPTVRELIQRNRDDPRKYSSFATVRSQAFLLSLIFSIGLSLKTAGPIGCSVRRPSRGFAEQFFLIVTTGQPSYIWTT